MRGFRTLWKGIGLFLLGLTLDSGARADAGPWHQMDYAAVRLISAVTATGSAETLPFGLEFRLQPGWKIYWRTPGDAGLPPVPDWSASENVRTVDMDWPVPERFAIFDIGTLGYANEIVFPLQVTPDQPGESVSLRGSVDYLICSDICIPDRAEIVLDLPSGTGGAGDLAHLIDRHASVVPVADPYLAGFHIDGATLRTGANGAILVDISVSAMDAALVGPDVFIEGPNGVYFDAPTIAIGPNGRNAVLSVPAPVRLDLATLDGTDLTVTVVDGMRALEARITATERTLAPIPMTETLAAGPSLWLILGFALLGGLLLNLMPCVLPVLSLKLLSVVSKSGKESTHVRAGFLASSAGIVVSFLVLAGAAIAVKQTGMAVGWGIQFQQPVFLALMVALLTLFACNLLGLFEFRLPGFLSDRAANSGCDNHSLFGDFLTGAFATLLATPCSAPFLGIAVGFALAAGPGEILAVFFALGLGLALPYLLIAAVPTLIHVAPRPGSWMTYFKIVLAIALVGTAIWLLTVLSTVLGTENAIAVGALAAVAATVLATRRLENSRLGQFAWPISAMLAVATVLAPLSMPTIQNAPQSTAIQDAASIRWVAFDETAITRHVANGKTVLVDVTADWCVTCQWNKRTVFQTEQIEAWLASDDVIAMQADWTRPDPAIAAYLARYGRYGIPFNIVYGPAAPEGIPLSELLSEGALLSAAADANPNASIATVH